MRDDLSLGKYGYSIFVSAIIVDPNKCDTPLLDWCLRMGHWIPEDHNKKCVRAQDAQKHPQIVRWGQVYVMQMWIAAQVNVLSENRAGAATVKVIKDGLSSIYKHSTITVHPDPTGSRKGNEAGKHFTF